MLSQKQRKIPTEVSVWSQKDTTIHNQTTDSGCLSNHTRFSVFSRRKLYDDLISLSFERHRKIARYDYGRKTFLEKQRKKAERSMPGLLPYVDSLKDELDDANRTDSFQSLKSNSFVKSEYFFLPTISNDKRFQELLNLFDDIHC